MLIRTSTPPQSRTHCSTASRQACAEATSTDAYEPCTTSANTSANRPVSLPMPKIVAPERESSRAVSAPRPDEAPVTNATLFCKAAIPVPVRLGSHPRNATPQKFNGRNRSQSPQVHRVGKHVPTPEAPPDAARGQQHEQAGR